MENWKPVLGYEGYYEVSDYGRVRSLTRRTAYRNRVHRGRTLDPGLNHSGYPTVTLCVGGRREHWFVHELVLIAFVGQKPEGLITRHKDGCKTNNNLSNLAWGTFAENAADAREHGTHEIGSMRKQAKLTEAAVAEMRKEAAEGTPVKDIAKKWGVAFRTAAHAISGTKWKHVDAPARSRPITYLTDDQVRLVRKLLGDGVSLSEVGRRVGRPASSIQAIRDGRGYSHVS
jgi:hypothetical protein